MKVAIVLSYYVTKGNALSAEALRLHLSPSGKILKSGRIPPSKPPPISLVFELPHPEIQPRRKGIRISFPIPYATGGRNYTQRPGGADMSLDDCPACFKLWQVFFTATARHAGLALEQQVASAHDDLVAYKQLEDEVALAEKARLAAKQALQDHMARLHLNEVAT